VSRARENGTYARFLAPTRPPVPGSGTAGRPEDVGTGGCERGATRHDSSTSPVTDKVRDVRLTGVAANPPGTPTLDPCQEAGTGATGQVPTCLARDIDTPRGDGARSVRR
jgi:hypothetical protein